MNELAIFKAVSQARADMAEGIDATVAVRNAARRYGVNVDAVDAHVRIARRECRKAASAIEAVKSS